MYTHMYVYFTHLYCMLTSDSDQLTFLFSGLKVEVKDWVMVEYDQVGYPGEVVAKEESDDFKVSVMIPAGNHWKWPNPRDAIFYKRSQIVCKLNKPVPINSRGHFNFAEPLSNNG